VVNALASISAQPSPVTGPGPAIAGTDQSVPVNGASLPWLLPAGIVALWWVNDLSFQWATLIEYQFGWIVLMLTAYLAWERWPTRPKTDIPAPFWFCFLLCLGAAPLVTASELYKNAVARVPSTAFTLSLGCWLFLVSNILLVCGRRTLRHFLFPLLFFFVAVPLPKSIWNPVVFGLQQLVTVMDVESLRIMGVAAERQGSVINLPNCQVGVNEACSGIRSLQSSVMAALFVGDLTLRSNTWRVIFFGAGVFLAMAGNFFRSLYLAYSAYLGGPEQLKKVHDTAGWSVLAFTAVSLVILSLAITRFERMAENYRKLHAARGSA
jgi:exosortase